MREELKLPLRMVNKVGTHPTNVKSDEAAIPLSSTFLHRTVHDAGHDLRSPLFVIRGYTQLLQKTEDKGCLKRGIKLMEEASFKMEKTINGFVELMDIYTLPNQEIEPLSAEPIIDATILELSPAESLQNAITFRKNIIHTDIILFNKGYFTTIVKCLLENAISHNSEQDQLNIYIAFEKIDNDIVLTIQDDGQGIDPMADKNKLKKPFFKYTENPDQVGLGLAKVEAIAKVTGNQFDLESVHGAGTLCQFIFRS